MTVNVDRTSNQRLTPEKLAEYRDLLPLGRFVGVGGDALKLLLDEIDACWAERKPDETACRISKAHAERILQDWIEDDAHAESLRHWPDLRAAYEALHAIAESSSVEPTPSRCHFMAFRDPQFQCTKPRGHDGSHSCGTQPETQPLKATGEQS
jgi:hypothetical protein